MSFPSFHTRIRQLEDARIPPSVLITVAHRKFVGGSSVLFHSTLQFARSALFFSSSICYSSISTSGIQSDSQIWWHLSVFPISESSAVCFLDCIC